MSLQDIRRFIRIKMGRQAYYDAQESWVNPFDLFSTEWDDWWTGWKCACAEDGMWPQVSVASHPTLLPLRMTIHVPPAP